MDASLKYELDSCIRELNAIARELEDAADEVSASIQGMNTWPYKREIYKSAERYRKAAQKLGKIK